MSSFLEYQSPEDFLCFFGQRLLTKIRLLSMTVSPYPSVQQAALKVRGTITTGDIRLDEMLGGGVRPGVVTELVGESASGKTQFALQLSLLVQLPVGKGGLSGSACYLTTNGILSTSRLFEMAQESKLANSESCILENIHTRSTSSVPELRHILSQGIPSLIQQLSEAHPLRLLVLDSISALLHTNTKTTSKTLFERSRELSDVSLMLHHLASMYHLAIVVINEVNSVFERVDSSASNLPRYLNLDQVFYTEQSCWFSRGDSLPCEGYKEAGLGLVWASQIGVRVLMTRTGRRKHLLNLADHTKRRKNSAVDPGIDARGLVKDSEAILIRRLSVIFSCFSPPDSIDFIILRSGITSVSEKLSTCMLE